MNKIIALAGMVLLSFALLSCSSSHLDTIRLSDKAAIQDIDYEYLGPDLWQLIENDYAFAPKHYNNKLVKKQVSALRARPEMLSSINERSSLFLFHIRNELIKRDMPIELALLPAVESSYDPYAYSSAGAAGLWQFTEKTGKSFGLGNTWWYSSRRDFEESTSAALDYLEYLYAKYNDWELSLAAYNAGERAVNKAIAYNKARHQPTDYWHLHKLPRETENYIPRLIAFSYVFSKKQRIELGLRPIEARPFWAKIDNQHQIPLAQIVEKAGINEEAFFLLNAGHNQWVTSPHKKHVFVPIDNKHQLEDALESFSTNAPLWVSYKVERGDTVATISDKFDISHKLLSHFNQVDKIAPGNYVIIPINKGTEEYTTNADYTEPPRYVSRNRAQKGHRIKKGENLSSIARDYSISVASLQKMNGIGNPNKVRAGRKITVSKGDSVNSPTVLLAGDYNREVIRNVYYRARRGDSLYRIANKFNVSIEQVKKWNQGKSIGEHIYAGQLIRLYLDVTDL